MADAGKGPSPPSLFVDKKGMNVSPPPPVLISRSPSMKSPFLSFLIIHTGYWTVLFSSDEALQIIILFHQGQFPW